MAEAVVAGAGAEVSLDEMDMARQILYVPSVSGTPGIILGVQSIIVTMWWVLIMFVYVKNVSTDADLMTIGNVRTVPLGWWWERIAEYQGKYIFLGLSLLFSWVLYGAIGITELVAFIMYMYDNQ